MSVLLMLCVALLPLATPGRDTRPWEPCTGKGRSEPEAGVQPCRSVPPSFPRSRSLPAGFALGAPAGRGGPAEAERRGREAS